MEQIKLLLLNYSKMKLQLKRPHKISIISLSIFIFIVFFGWLGFPKLLNWQIAKMVALKKGNQLRDFYEKLPFPMTFKIYLFNLTNPGDFEKGAKPILEEIGPYIYDEWKEKVDIIENEKEDTLEYRIRNTYVFNQNESGPLTGNEVVTIIHPLMAGLALTVANERPGVLKIVDVAMNRIYRNPKDIFLRATVDSLLFTGLYVDCNLTDFVSKTVCSQMETEAGSLLVTDPRLPGFFKFSLFGPKNGTVAQKVKVKRGIRDINQLGEILEFEGKSTLKYWWSKECNTFKGTDSTIFPPFSKEDEDLISFSPDICRTLPAYFIKNTYYDGIPVRLYGADFGDQTSIPSERCYCPTSKFCFKKGIHDLTKCMGAPLVGSLPHFYQSDQSYQEGVVGLNASKDKHEIVILLEGLTGAPVLAKKRIQFAMPVRPIPQIQTMRRLPNVVLPLFWVEEGVELNKTYTWQLKLLYPGLMTFNIAKWIILVCSLMGLGVGLYMLQRLKKDEVIYLKKDYEFNETGQT